MCACINKLYQDLKGRHVPDGNRIIFRQALLALTIGAFDQGLLHPLSSSQRKHGNLSQMTCHHPTCSNHCHLVGLHQHHRSRDQTSPLISFALLATLVGMFLVSSYQVAMLENGGQRKVVGAHLKLLR